MYLEISGKYCDPADWEAPFITTLSEAKEFCSNDLTCTQFFWDEDIGEYYMCNNDSNIFTSTIKTLFVKGKMS